MQNHSPCAFDALNRSIICEFNYVYIRQFRISIVGEGMKINRENMGLERGELGPAIVNKPGTSARYYMNADWLAD